MRFRPPDASPRWVFVPQMAIWGTDFMSSLSSGGRVSSGGRSSGGRVSSEGRVWNFTLTFVWLVFAYSTRRDTFHEVFFLVVFLTQYMLVKAVGMLARLVSIAWAAKETVIIIYLWSNHPRRHNAVILRAGLESTWELMQRLALFINISLLAWFHRLQL